MSHPIDPPIELPSFIPMDEGIGVSLEDFPIDEIDNGLNGYIVELPDFEKLFKILFDHK